MTTKETHLLTSYLLSAGGRGQLSTYLSLSQFTDLFPRSQRTNPQIAILYRELQHQRALVADEVTRNIAAEVKRGERQRREVVSARRREEGGGEGRDEGERERRMEIEVRVFCCWVLALLGVVGTGLGWADLTTSCLVRLRRGRIIISV